MYIQRDIFYCQERGASFLSPYCLLHCGGGRKTQQGHHIPASSLSIDLKNICSVYHSMCELVNQFILDA